jgi:predicted ribosome quality control (RQC) complex YloA/Tae2 family protein
MKLKMSSHDVSAIIKELNNFNYIGSRINNIYDISNKVFCLKLDLKNKKEKEFLVLDSGKKIYIIDKFKSDRMLPSSFCSKFRKHLKNKRIESIKQINFDRVVDITIGKEEMEHHIIIELYATGNIILTDKNYVILTLLHIHIYNDNNKVIVGNKYPIGKATINLSKYNITSESVYNWVKQKKRGLKKNTTFGQLLFASPLNVYGSYLLEHVLMKYNIDIKSKINIENFKLTNDLLNNIIDELNNIKKINDINGYIILDHKNNYKSFIPYLYLQFKKDKYIKYDCFLECVKTYFHTTNDKEKDKKLLKKKKIEDPNERAKYNLELQIKKINDKINKNQKFIDFFDNYNNIVLFKRIFILIKDNINEKSNNIKSILYNNTTNIKNININKKENIIVLKINNLNINVNYLISIDKNLEKYYSNNKELKKKIKKINILIDNLKKRKKKINKKINKIPANNNLIEKNEYLKYLRWYQKYNWCFSSNSFLIISGKTAQQNEEIVKKYLDNNDIYVHSDVHGSGSCIIKNNSNTLPHPSTIEEACSFVICHTKCWNSGSPDNAWWVYANQVSKTAPSGEYISTGGFMIRGKKNYIKNIKLELGFGILFKNKTDDNLSVSSNDSLQYSVPICGPYKSLFKLKYKVKIIPGNNKIGKTVKLILNKFMNNCNELEKKSIKTIPDDYLHKVMRNKIKLVIKKN